MYDFYKAAFRVHGQKFDYSRVRYKNANTKVTIKCNVCNHEFQTTPGNHIHKKTGCPKCSAKAVGKTLQKSKTAFIQDARVIHKNKYSYEKALYKGSFVKIDILCNKCGSTFKQTPASHLSGRGCKCSSRKPKIKPDELKRRVYLKYGTKFSYKFKQFKSLSSRVDIRCNTCNGVFNKKIVAHLNGLGCPLCKKRQTLEELKRDFVNKAISIHNELYSYKDMNYISMWNDVEIKCLSCGNKFNLLARDHLRGKGCSCKTSFTSGYSKMSIQWLESEAKRRRWKIQHAGNTGEFRIPGTKYRADGYNVRSKTVFEFYGDNFHGNINKFDIHDKPHPFNEKTTLELYETTMHRGRKIKALGYNVVSIWESDWLDR